MGESSQSFGVVSDITTYNRVAASVGLEKILEDVLQMNPKLDALVIFTWCCIMYHAVCIENDHGGKHQFRVEFLCHEPRKEGCGWHWRDAEEEGRLP